MVAPSPRIASPISAIPSLCVAVLLLAFAACGPAAAENARHARYHADSSVAFRGVVDAVAAKYKVVKADAAAGMVATEARWYEPDGTFEDQAHSGGGVMGEDGSILLSYEVRIVPAAHDFAIEVVPRALQIRSGYAAPFPLAPDDPAMPGWVTGKTEDLYLRIHTQLQAFETKAAPPTTAP